MLKVLITLALSFSFLQVQALDQFKRILIADQGRIKPFDSFSKSTLLKISGQSKKHNQWLKEALFRPQDANEKDVFLIENPELKEALNLDLKKKRFSFNELDKVSEKLFKLSTQEAGSGLLQKQIEILKSNFDSYLNITNSFLFAIENPAFTVSQATQKALTLEKQKNSLYNIITKSQELSEAIAQVNTNNNVSKEQKDLLDLSLRVFSWVENFKSFDEIFKSSSKLSIISLDKNNWLNPWQAIYQKDSDAKASLWLLNQAYLNRVNQEAFNQTLKLYNKQILENSNYSSLLIEAEILYNKLNPFKYALIFYFIAFILLFILKNNTIAYSLGITAFSFNSIGLILRMLIMQRPPVSNIYETFIFIAWAIALIGLVIYLLEKNKIGLILSNLSGFALLLISFKFAAEGDTMQALIAVLNSNFWLSTHVICITLGYAGVFAAGIIGHSFVIQKLLKADDKTLAKTKSYLLGILGFGLAMSFFGTLLGGIWADQSWGRFWGWDPKENGALIIVLWTALIFHARLSGFIKDIGLALASVFGCIVVMLSWLGVNLLGVGLHSYGFTSGLFYALLSYCLFELAFIVFFALKNNKA